MDPTTRQGIAVAAGAGGGDATYVDEVFSTFLYEGNGSTQSINNGIDLSGEGGLVWIKRRDSSNGHFLVDTERGRASNLNSTSTSAAGTSSADRDLVSFNNDGFTVGPAQYENLNGSGRDFVSWSFRKAPGFFDVQTFTVSSGTHTINHSLGTTPGMMIVKCTTVNEGWYVWHRSIPNNALGLNSTNPTTNFSAQYIWGNGTSVVQPTSTQFTMRNNNAGNETFVVYLFAHDDQSFGTDSDEAIIKCGSYTGTGSNGNHVNVGFEPQFLLIKNTSSSSTNWMVLDVMRGLPAASGATAKPLFANTTEAEATNNSIEPSPTGFTPQAAGSYTNASGDTFIYMAIRRPNKPPTAATEVFNADFEYGTDTSISGYLGYVADMNIITVRAGNANNSFVRARLTGDGYLSTTHAGAQVSQTIGFWDNMLGFYESSGTLDTGKIQYIFRRAPGFFDVVTYTGTGSAMTINHNLDVAPELMIVKCRSAGLSWYVYDAVNGVTNYLILNSNSASSTSNASLIWNNTAPTSTQFSVGPGGAVAGNDTFVAYLLATLDGISKVGSYTGTGSNINVDCGFTAGARFVLIKRTDSSGDWYVWDTERGIVSGNDPYLLLNSTAAEVTNTDYIDPLNAGFTVTSSAPAALNTSGGTYLFLAIA